MSKPLITIFGATGAQGGGLARALLCDGRRDFRVRAVTREPGGAAAQRLAEIGAETRFADLDDAGSVQRAMHGAHGAFCMTDFWTHGSPQTELLHATTLAEAARREGVRHVVWSTLEDTRRLVPPDGSRMPLLMGRYNVPHADAKGEADREFTARGLPLTLLLTSFHWDNLLRFGMGPRRDAQGRLVLLLPMDAAALPGIAASDVGACAAGVFRLGAALVGRRIGIAGEHLTGDQMARALARALDEPVRHVAVPRALYAGLDIPHAPQWANMLWFMREFNAACRAARCVTASRALHAGLQSFGAWLSHVAPPDVARLQRDCK